MVLGVVTRGQREGVLEFSLVATAGGGAKRLRWPGGSGAAARPLRRAGRSEAGLDLFELGYHAVAHG